jgi:hypothetical protein
MNSQLKEQIAGAPAFIKKPQEVNTDFPGLPRSESAIRLVSLRI